MAVMNIAARNVHEMNLFEYLLSVIWGKYLGVELLDHLVTLYLTFWGAAELFPTILRSH